MTPRTQRAITRLIACALTFAAAGWTLPGLALDVVVAAPYINLHTGPGPGYPVTRVLERGERANLIKERTAWIKVAGPDGTLGWAHRSHLDLDSTVGDRPLAPSRETGRWSLGFGSGGLRGEDTGNRESLWFFLGYVFNEHLTLEGRWSEVVEGGTESSGLAASFLYDLRPDWQISPYFRLGVARTASGPERSRKNRMLTGGGVRGNIHERLALRLEYNNAFRGGDDSEVEEWILGFALRFY